MKAFTCMHYGLKKDSIWILFIKIWLLRLLTRNDKENDINKSIINIHKRNQTTNIDKKIPLPRLKPFGNRLQKKHPSHIHSSKDLIFRNKYNIMPRQIHLKLKKIILQSYLFY